MRHPSGGIEDLGLVNAILQELTTEPTEPPGAMVDRRSLSEIYPRFMQQLNYTVPVDGWYSVNSPVGPSEIEARLAVDPMLGMREELRRARHERQEAWVFDNHRLAQRITNQIINLEINIDDYMQQVRSMARSPRVDIR